MSKKLKNIFLPRQPLTSDELRKLHSGDMTPEQRHEYEKRLADDPFAQEALEGLEGLSDDEIGTLLPQMQSGDTKTGGVDEYTSVIRLLDKPWWRMAAAAAALLLIGTFLWQLMLSPQQESMTAYETKEQTSESTEPEVTTPAPVAEPVQESIPGNSPVTKDIAANYKAKEAVKPMETVPGKHPEEAVSTANELADSYADREEISPAKPSPEIMQERAAKSSGNYVRPRADDAGKLIALVEEKENLYAGSKSYAAESGASKSKKEAPKSAKKIRESSTEDKAESEKEISADLDLAVMQTYLAGNYETVITLTAHTPLPEKLQRLRALAFYRRGQVAEAITATADGSHELTNFLHASLLLSAGRGAEALPVFEKLSIQAKDVKLREQSLKMVEEHGK